MIEDKDIKDFNSNNAIIDDPQILNNEYSLKYSGYKTVVVEFGNQGELELNQSLLLDLKGQISQEFYVRAHLSDQEIPLHPQGYTVTLKEVDKIFVEVYSRRYGFLIGDYFVDFGKSNLDKMYRQVKGIEIKSNFKEIYQKGGIALNEGLYHSYQFKGEQGKQTNYFLVGKNGENLISIFFKTERLWKNGVLLQRDKDYLIYYGEGKVDFLQKLLISSEDIFLIEFQYTLQDYSNTLLYNTIKDTIGDWQWGIRGFIEQDELIPTGRFSLSDDDLEILQEKGDSTKNLYNLDSVKISLPQRGSFFVSDFKWIFEERFQNLINTSFYLSEKDNNLFSKLNDNNNIGYGFDFDLEYNFGKKILKKIKKEWRVKTKINYRSPFYEKFNPILEDYLFLERWNFPSYFLKQNYYYQFFDILNRSYSFLKLGVIFGYFNGKARDHNKVMSYISSPYVILGEGKCCLKTQVFFTQNNFLQNLKKETWKYYRKESHFFLEKNIFSSKIDWVEEWDFMHQQLVRRETHLKSEIKFLQTWNKINWNLQGEYLNYQIKSLESNLKEDSLIQISVSHFLSFYRLGIWSSEILTSMQSIKTYNQNLKEKQTSKNILMEWKNDFVDNQQGYRIKVKYKLNPTDEFTLYPQYIKVNSGSGEFVCDSFSQTSQFNHCILADEKGGDFRLEGYTRDSLGKKIINLSWIVSFSLTDQWFTNRQWGSFFKNISFYVNFDVSHKGERTVSQFYPLFFKNDIDFQLEGKRLINPVLSWNNTEKERTIRLEWNDNYEFSSFNFTKISHFKQSLYFSERVYDLWNFACLHNYNHREYQFFTTNSPIERKNRSWNLQIDISYFFAKIWTWKPSFIYDVSRGSENVHSYRILSYILKNKMEKLLERNNKLSVEHSIHLRTGNGIQSLFNGSLGFSKGFTHRFNAIFDFNFNKFFTGSIKYLLRKDPNKSSVIQKLFMESKAFF